MVGIRKIAQEAGVSPATVSRVLNSDPTFAVSASTRANILKVADKYHYQPQVNHSVSQRKKKNNILVITTHSLEAESHDPYFAKVHDGIIQEASTLNIHVKDFIRFPATNFKFENTSNYDGIIVAGVFTKKFYQQLARYNSRIILIDDYRYLPEYDIVRNSYYDETRILLENLFHEGIRRIGFIGGKIWPMTVSGPSDDSYQDIRVKAYREWMAEHKLPLLLKENGWRPKDGFQAMNELYTLKPKAILVASDQLAVGACRAINQHGSNIPTDLQVISYNDSNIAAYLVPSLSSINPNSLQMGKAAVRLMDERLHSPREAPVHLTLPASLTKRESSR